MFVTSQDGETINLYFLTLLGDIPDYLAYLLSDVYTVDQVTRIIYVEVSEPPTIGEVLSHVELAPGSSIEFMDKDGAAKTVDDLVDDEDIFRVTAANGVTVVEYVVSLTITSVEDILSDRIKLYPNPSTGKVFIEGLEPGTRIQVYNIVGVPVINRIAQDSTEVLSLEDRPGGLYFVVVTSKNDIIGRYKLIIR